MVAMGTKLETIDECNGGNLSISGDIIRHLRHARGLPLSEPQKRYVRRYGNQPWIDRAKTAAFWQCRACEFDPRDDETWDWFIKIPWRHRSDLVQLTVEIRRVEREIRTKKVPNLSFGVVQQF